MNIPSESGILREQVRRWVEAGRHHLGMIRWMLDDRDWLARELEAVKRENEQLRRRADIAERQRHQLGEDVNRLVCEADRYRKEREEISAILASVDGILIEVLSRLRGPTA